MTPVRRLKGAAPLGRSVGALDVVLALCAGRAALGRSLKPYRAIELGVVAMNSRSQTRL